MSESDDMSRNLGDEPLFRGWRVVLDVVVVGGSVWFPREGERLSTSLVQWSSGTDRRRSVQRDGLVVAELRVQFHGVVPAGPEELRHFFRIVVDSSSLPDTIRSMPSMPTSIRFDEDERVLLEAIAAHFLAEHGLRMSHTDVVRAALRSFVAPSNLGETAGAWRRAHKRVFTRTTETDS